MLSLCTSRFVLSVKQKRFFEKLSLYCDRYAEQIPVTFILGRSECLPSVCLSACLSVCPLCLPHSLQGEGGTDGEEEEVERGERGERTSGCVVNLLGPADEVITTSCCK